MFCHRRHRRSNASGRRAAAESFYRGLGNRGQRRIQSMLWGFYLEIHPNHPTTAADPLNENGSDLLHSPLLIVSMIVDVVAVVDLVAIFVVADLVAVDIAVVDFEVLADRIHVIVLDATFFR